jgi:hypothetical protein
MNTRPFFALGIVFFESSTTKNQQSKSHFEEKSFDIDSFAT